ncbi:hypothetical protein FEO95_18090 [Stenotrophomonas maltophilia]|nr:hypothetical protein FEO95_18090 [Stenotrophomonas maltophilia]
MSAMDGATEPPWTDSRRPLQPDPPRHPTECQLLPLPLFRRLQGAALPQNSHTTGMLCWPRLRYGGVAITISASE